MGHDVSKIKFVDLHVICFLTVLRFKKIQCEYGQKKNKYVVSVIQTQHSVIGYL